MLADDPAYAEKARADRRADAGRERISRSASTSTFAAPRSEMVAYHAACSLQHGQKILDAPKALLRARASRCATPAEAHLCCGSAGVYNILQPRIAAELRDRKVRNLARLKPDVIATGNIGCITQIGSATRTPVVHIVELLDWAQGGPPPFAVAEAGVGCPR